MAGTPDGGGMLASLGGLSTSVPQPLAFTYPSPMLLLNYPLIAANVRLLCGAAGEQTTSGAPATSFQGLLHCVRRTYEVEGALGLYRGSHLYLLHHMTRDSSRFLAEKAICYLEGDEEAGSTATSSSDNAEPRLARKRLAKRLVAKYAIDAVCYPILLASTRAVILRPDGQSFWEHLESWWRKDGLLTLFGGLFASLCSTGMEEIMDYVLSWCIDYCAKDQEVDLADKVLLKASGTSVVGILTQPVNYVGIIRRCQADSLGVKRQSTFTLLKSLPWYSTFQQLFFFSGIMALNVKLVAMKVQLKQEQEQQELNEIE